MPEKLRINWILAGANMAGGTKSNRLIAEAMVRRGHDVTIVYVDAPLGWPKLWRPRRFLRRCRLGLQARGQRQHHLEHSTARLLPVPHRPIRAQDVPDADVTIATWWETMEWIRDWPASKGVLAHFVRGYEVYARHPERVRAVYRVPGLKLVISHWLGEIMRTEYGHDDVVLVPNGVDWQQFHAPQRGRQPVPTIGIMFSSNPIKGAKTGFAALRLVQDALPKARVVLLTAHRLNRRGGLPRNTEIELRPDPNEMARVYQSVDCWLVPSETEGFGMPALEAAGCRCPVVATRSGGPEDIVMDGVNGRLVPVGDERAMADAILEILRLDEPAWRKMSEASYAIAHRFDWNRSAEILEATLIQAVERAGVEGTTAPAAAT